MHIGKPLTHGNGRNAQLPCQPFARLLVLDKNYFNSIKRSSVHLYLIIIKCKYNKCQCVLQILFMESGKNGYKLSIITNNHHDSLLLCCFNMNLYGKILCNNKFYDIAIRRHTISIAVFLDSDPRAYIGMYIVIFVT